MKKFKKRISNGQFPTANFQVMLSADFPVTGAKGHLGIGYWKLAIGNSVLGARNALFAIALSAKEENDGAI